VEKLKNLFFIKKTDRFIYYIFILIDGFGLFRMSFFAFFPPRLVAQTLFLFRVIIFFKICLVGLSGKTKMKRNK